LKQINQNTSQLFRDGTVPALQKNAQKAKPHGYQMLQDFGFRALIAIGRTGM